MQQLQKKYRSRLYALSEGVNVLLAAGDPLLAMVSTLDGREMPQDRIQFRDDIVFELNIFSRQLKLGEHDEKLIRLSQQIMTFFIEQRLRKIVGWEDFTLTEQGGLSLDWFKEVIAKILAKQIEQLALVEFVYTWLKINPWILDEGGGSSTQTRDIALLLSGKLYNLIQGRRGKNSVSLLVGDWNTTGSTAVQVGRYSLGSPYWWLAGAVGLLLVGQLLLGGRIWQFRDSIARSLSATVVAPLVSKNLSEGSVDTIMSVKLETKNC